MPPPAQGSQVFIAGMDRFGNRKTAPGPLENNEVIIPRPSQGGIRGWCGQGFLGSRLWTLSSGLQKAAGGSAPTALPLCSAVVPIPGFLLPCQRPPPARNERQTLACEPQGAPLVPQFVPCSQNSVRGWGQGEVSEGPRAQGRGAPALRAHGPCPGPPQPLRAAPRHPCLGQSHFHSARIWLQLFFFSFFLFAPPPPHGISSSRDRGSDLSHRCGLGRSFSNAGSLEFSSWRSRNKPN